MQKWKGRAFATRFFASAQFRRKKSSNKWRCPLRGLSSTLTKFKTLLKFLPRWLGIKTNENKLTINNQFTVKTVVQINHIYPIA